MLVRTIAAAAMLLPAPTPITQLAVDSCTVPTSNVDATIAEEDEAFRAYNHSVQATLDATLGAPQIKERVAAQLRRGLIGVVADAGARTVTVVVTPEHEGALAVKNVVVGCHSAASLIEAEDVLIGRSWHPDARLAAFSYSLRGEDSRFHVSFDRRYPEAGEALRKRLGKRAEVTPADNARAGRLDDGRPHFGGAGIREGAGTVYDNRCTSGFTVRRNASDGQYGTVTAAHCFGDGVYIYSGPKYHGYSWGRWNYPRYDTLGIRSGSETYDNVIHVDPCCPSTRTVVGRHGARVGDYVCFSGMSNRAICSIRVTSTSASYCDANGCTYGLIESTRSGQVFVRAGDSGAPIYVRGANNTAAIAGMVIASAGNGTIGYGELLGTIESYLNVALVTW